MKRILSLLLIFLLSACNNSTVKEEIKSNTLPNKDNPNSTLMSESPLSALNIDDYLFLDNVMYVDTRSPQMFLQEGHIAGFVNIPYYEGICRHEKEDGILFTMDKITNEDGTFIPMGNTGSFKPNYKESIQILYNTFPKDKQIVFIASAGVESCYLMNLLIQYGYDASLLYNAGAVSNTLGKNVAYKDLENKKHFVEPIDTFNTSNYIDWGELTPIE